MSDEFTTNENGSKTPEKTNFQDYTRGVTPNRLGRMMVALGIQRIHTEYGNVYRLVKLKDSSAA